MDFVIFAFIVAVFAAVIAASSKRTQAVRQAWARAAVQLGLTAGGSTFRPMRLDGTIGGLAIAVDVYTTGGKHKTRWTRYRATFPRPGTALLLRRQTGLSRITKLFGATDLEIGDAEFDDAFMIKAESDQQAAQYLTMQRRSLLLRLFSIYREVNLTPDYFEIITRGYETDPGRLITTTRRLVSAARVLAGLHGEDGRMEKALQRRAAGDMAEAAAALRGAAEDLRRGAATGDLEEPLLEAELLAGSGQIDEARPLLARLSEELPADEEVAGLQRALDRMSPETPAPDAADIDMQELLDDLFVSNRLSFETTEIFDEHYVGRHVAWSGRLKSLRDYNNDLDFGRGPATKLVVAIAQVEHDLYGAAEVDAVVSVPQGSASHLERGALVRFEGHLLKADSMMRNVFVRDARLS